MVQFHPGPPAILQGSLVGGVAQLGERLPCTQEVIGSNPFTSTMIFFVERAVEVAFMREELNRLATVHLDLNLRLKPSLLYRFDSNHESVWPFASHFRGRGCSLTIWVLACRCMVSRLCLLFCGQAIKGKRWMPWRQEAMKDVVSCDKLRGVAKQTLIRGFLNGETHLG